MATGGDTILCAAIAELRLQRAEPGGPRGLGVLPHPCQARRQHKARLGYPLRAESLEFCSPRARAATSAGSTARAGAALLVDAAPGVRTDHWRVALCHWRLRGGSDWDGRVWFDRDHAWKIE